MSSLQICVVIPIYKFDGSSQSLSISVHDEQSHLAQHNDDTK